MSKKIVIIASIFCFSAQLFATRVLFIASRDGNFYAAFCELSKNGSDFINARYDDGETALTAACQRGHLRVARLLLIAGANPNTCSGRDGPPLHCAAAAGHLNIVRMLLAVGANPHYSVMRLGTPMHCAAAAGHSGVVRLLLGVGADPFALDCDGRTPIQSAVWRSQFSVATLLQAACGFGSNPADVVATAADVDPLFIAIRNADEDSVRRMVCGGVPLRHHYGLIDLFAVPHHFPISFIKFLIPDPDPTVPDDDSVDRDDRADGKTPPVENLPVPLSTVAALIFSDGNDDLAPHTLCLGVDPVAWVAFPAEATDFDPVTLVDPVAVEKAILDAETNVATSEEYPIIDVDDNVAAADVDDNVAAADVDDNVAAADVDDNVAAADVDDEFHEPDCPGGACACHREETGYGIINYLIALFIWIFRIFAG
jgi:Ankyrin repeats (3 copies)/Ankyrin repeats (many copies)